MSPDGTNRISKLNAGVSRRKLLQRAAVIGAGAPFLATAAKAAAQASTPASNPFGAPGKRGGTYIFGLADATGVPRDFIPTSYYGTTGFFFSKLIFTPLILLDAKWGNPGPGLATDWQWSSDNKQLTMHLRKGVTFHDGTPFTANDVDYTFKLMVRNDPFPAVQDVTILEGAEAYKKGTTEDFPGLTVIDDATIRFNLASPSSVFERNISNVGILPAKAVGADALKPGTDIKTVPFFDGKAIGTGPFKIKRYDARTALTLEGNPSYFKGAPVLDSIVFQFALSGPAGVSALRSGQVDGTMVGDQDAASLKGVDTLDLTMDYSLSNVASLMFATDKEYLTVPVRQALLTAIDVDTLIKTIGYGFPKPAPSMIMYPELFPNEALPTYPYDVAKAKALLQEAKWDSSRKLQLGQWNQQGASNDLAVALIGMWKAVGVEAEFLLMDPANQVKTSQQIPHPYDVATATIAWLGYDPSSNYGRFGCSFRPNYANYCNPDFDSAMQQAIRSGTWEQAKPLYQKAQVILQTDLPYGPMYIEPVIFALSKSIHGGNFGRGPLNDIQSELWWKG